ncbi:unnamed protein product [Lampetra fluviatilis]
MDLPENNRSGQKRVIPDRRRDKRCCSDLDTCLQIPEHPIYVEEICMKKEEEGEEDIHCDDLDKEEHLQCDDLEGVDTHSAGPCGTLQATQGTADDLDQTDDGGECSTIESIGDKTLLCSEDDLEEEALQKDETASAERLSSPFGGRPAKAVNNENATEEGALMESGKIIFSFSENVLHSEADPEGCENMNIVLLNDPMSPRDSEGSDVYQHLEHDVFPSNETQHRQNPADMIIQVVIRDSLDQHAGKSNVVDKNDGAVDDRGHDPVALDNLVDASQKTSLFKNNNTDKMYWSVTKEVSGGIFDSSSVSAPCGGMRVGELRWNLETERDAIDSRVSITSTESEQTSQHGSPLYGSACSEPVQPCCSSSSSAACQAVLTREVLKIKLHHESQSVHQKVNAIRAQAFSDASAVYNFQDKRNTGHTLPPVSLAECKHSGLNIESSYCTHDMSQQHQRLQEEFWKQPVQCHPPTLPPGLPAPSSQPMFPCPLMPAEECSGHSRRGLEVWTEPAVSEPPKKKIRTLYTQCQLDKLEKVFQEDCYPDHERRLFIASAIEVSPQRVVVWFQNRRAKLRKLQRQKAQAVDVKKPPRTIGATATTTTIAKTTITATTTISRLPQEKPGSASQCPATFVFQQPPRPMTQPPRSMPADVGCAPPGFRGLRLQTPDGGVACAASPAPVGSSGPQLPTSSLPCATAALSVPPPPPLSGTYCSFVCTPGLELGTEMKRTSPPPPPPRPQCSDGSDGGTAGTTLPKEPRSVANWCSGLANATSMATAAPPLQLMSPPLIKRSANLPLHMPATHAVPLEQNGPEHAPAIPCNVGSVQRNAFWEDKQEEVEARPSGVGFVHPHTLLAKSRGSVITNSVDYAGEHVPPASAEHGVPPPLPYMKGQGLPMHYCCTACFPSFPPSLGMPPFPANSQVYLHSHSQPPDSVMSLSASGARSHCQLASTQDSRNQQQLRQSPLQQQQQQYYSTLQQDSMYKTGSTSELLFQHKANSDNAGFSDGLRTQTHLKSYGIPAGRDLLTQSYLPGYTLTALQQLHSGYGTAVHSQIDDCDGPEVVHSGVPNGFYLTMDSGQGGMEAAQAAALEAGTYPLGNAAYSSYGDNSSHFGQPLTFSANHVALPILPANVGHSADSGHSFYAGHRADIGHAPLVSQAGQLSYLTHFNRSCLANHALKHENTDCLNYSVGCRHPHTYNYKPVSNQPVLYNNVPKFGHSVHGNNAAQPNHSAHLSHPVHCHHPTLPRPSFNYNHSAFLQHSAVPNNATPFSHTLQVNHSGSRSPLPVSVQSAHPTHAFRHGQRLLSSPTPLIYGTYFLSTADEQGPGTLQYEATQFNPRCDTAVKSPGLAVSTSCAVGLAEPTQCTLSGGDGGGGGSAFTWQELPASSTATSASQFYYQPADCSGSGSCLPPRQMSKDHVTGGNPVSDYVGHSGNLTGSQYVSASGAAPAGSSERHFAPDDGMDGRPAWPCSPLSVSTDRPCPSDGEHGVDDGEPKCAGEMLVERIAFTAIDAMDFQDDGTKLTGQCGRSLGSCSDSSGTQDSTGREEDLDQAALVHEENRESCSSTSPKPQF